MMQHNGNLLRGVSDQGLLKLARINDAEVSRQRMIAMARQDRPGFELKARWVVASCQSGTEQAVRDSLYEQRIECWCPCERLPVVETQAMPLDNFLTGAFQLGAQIFDREDANVEISTEDGNNFTKNLVTIRAEERLAMATYRPEAFVKGAFATAMAAATQA